MAINNANLKLYLSGGVSNTDPDLSLGGARSTTEVSSTAMNNLFDNVDSTEATNGDVEYRCFYFRNEDADVNGLISPKLWFVSNTPSPTTNMKMGLDIAGLNGTATTIANESTAPSNVVFSDTYTTKALGLALPDMYENDYIAIWFERTINSSTASASSDLTTIRVEGDTV